MTMPKQKPGRSKQDYGTPEEFLLAATSKLGIKTWARDLAASDENAVTFPYFTEEQNSLVQCWSDMTAWQWLNPPYSDIRRWVQKAYGASLEGAQIAVLIPASVGANWWRDWVHEKAHVLCLNGRIKFVGATGLYPKDCALLLYSKRLTPGYHIWTWPKEGK